MQEKSFPGGPRVPPPVDGVQVNFCKNMDCHHFGSPASTEKQPRGPGAKDKPNDGYILGTKGGGFRTRIICKACGQNSALKSNQGVIEEANRLGDYLAPKPLQISCPDSACANHHCTVANHPDHYYRFGKTAAGTRRYRCKLCKKTFSEPGKPTDRQRVTHKNKTLFRLLVNKTPFKRICEVLEIGGPMLYRKIDLIHAQCLAFVADRERQIEQMEIPRLYIASDRQEFSVNWTNTRDKRNVILKAIASVDIGTSYVFGMHTNFDLGLDPFYVEQDAEAIGDTLRSMPFRKYARVWLNDDHNRMARKRDPKEDGPIPEGGLLRDVAKRYSEVLRREEIEASDDPATHTKLPTKGMQIHEEYTLYGHFFFLKRLFRKVEKVRFYLDQDSGIRAACLSAFVNEVLDGRCDAFFVRINKDLTVHQKQKLVNLVEKEFEVSEAEHPYLSKTSIRLLKIMEDMKRLKTIGKWEDRWLSYPFPDMSEPEKAVCYLTNRNDYDETRMANLYLKASLHAVDSYFNQVRTRLSPLQRAKHSQSNSGRTWYGYQPYKPEIVQKLLDILRVFHNYCLKSKKDKKTPAMRLGLAKSAIDLDTIIYFRD